MKKWNHVLFVVMMLTFHIQVHSQCSFYPPMSHDEISKAVALVSYEGFRFTGTLVNNNNEDGRLLFLTSSYPFKNYCDGVSSLAGTTPVIYNHITFTWILDDEVHTTSGANILTPTWNEIVVLELHERPPFESVSYLGVDIQDIPANSPSPERCISHLPFSYPTSFPSGEEPNLEMSQKIELEPKAITKNGIDINTNCSTDSTVYDFGSNASPAYGAYLIKEWNYSGNYSGNMIQHEYGEYAKGSPLLNAGNEVVGIYVTKVGGLECEKDSAYFVSLHSHDIWISEFFSNVDRGISIIEGCKEEEILDDPIIASEVYEASVRITGSSSVNPNGSNISVVFRAGVEVILEPGFDSGNDFIAEIAPCDEAIITPLPTRIANDGSRGQESIGGGLGMVDEIKAYPTVIVDDWVTLESEHLEDFAYTLADLQGRVLLAGDFKHSRNTGNKRTLGLPDLPQGVYLLHLSNGTISKTVKLVKQ